jgi:hypothetical protein
MKLTSSIFVIAVVAVTFMIQTASSQQRYSVVQIHIAVSMRGGRIDDDWYLLFAKKGQQLGGNFI